MVSFSCEACNETLAKKKLDAHRGRCRQAVFTCLDCNNTFQGTSYREHTSCISEAQKYERTVYRGEKKKGKGKQNGVAAVNGSAPPASAVDVSVEPAPAPAAVETAEEAAPVTAEEESKQESKMNQKKGAKEKKKKQSKSDAAVEEDIAMVDVPENADPPVEQAVINGEDHKGKKPKKEKKEKKTKKAEEEDTLVNGVSEGQAAEEPTAAPQEQTESEEKVAKKGKKEKKTKKDTAEKGPDPAAEEPQTEVDDKSAAGDVLFVVDTTPSAVVESPAQASKKRKRDAETAEVTPSKPDDPQPQDDFVPFGDLGEGDDGKKKLQERKRPRTEKEIARKEKRVKAKTNYDAVHQNLRKALNSKSEEIKAAEPGKSSFNNSHKTGTAHISVNRVVRDIMSDPAVQTLTPKEAKHMKNKLRKEERKNRLTEAAKQRSEKKKEEKVSTKILEHKVAKLDAKMERDRVKREKLQKLILKAQEQQATATATAPEAAQKA